MPKLIEPKEICIEDKDGHNRTYRIGKVPYASGGRRLAVEAISKLKKLDYIDDQDLARMMFCHVAVLTSDGQEIILATDELVNNHVPDIPTGLKIEMALVEHNTGFSPAGGLRTLQQGWLRIIEQLNTITSTLSQVVSSVQESAPCTNSKTNTL